MDFKKAEKLGWLLVDFQDRRFDRISDKAEGKAFGITFFIDL